MEYVEITNSQLSSNSSSVEYILSNLDSIGYALGIHTDKIEEIEKELNAVDDKIDSSYNKAVASSKDYTDSSYERLYTYINDTSITFEYDVRV